MTGSSQSITGARSIIKLLEDLGIKVVFGMPGTQSVPLYEELRKSNLRIILVTHESSAAFMANGYYRASGSPAAVVTIGGPGFTNTLTGLAEARHDSAALLHVVVSSPEVADFSFNLQEIDITSIASPIVKRVLVARSAGDLSAGLAEAAGALWAGEPGPVVLEVSSAVLHEELNVSLPAMGPGLPICEVPSDELDAVASRIEASRKPLLFLGQGAADVGEPLRKLVERRNAIVVTNCSGAGAIADSHPNCVCSDFTGWGCNILNELISECDLVLTLGCKFSFNGASGFNLKIPRDKLVRVDIDAHNLETNYPASQAIQSDCAVFLPRLLQKLGAEPLSAAGWQVEEVLAYRDKFRDARLHAIDALPVKSCYAPELPGLFQSLADSSAKPLCLVTDSGLHQITARLCFRTNSQRGLIVPSDFQSMGFGVPAAIGAALARPSDQVVLVVGDGGILMSGMELSTAVREGLNILVIVLVDGFLGQIRLQQLGSYGKAESVKLGELELSDFAESLGLHFYSPSRDKSYDLRAILAQAGVKLLAIPLEDKPGYKSDTRKRILKELVRGVLGQDNIDAVKGVIKRGPKGDSNSH